MTNVRHAMHLPHRWQLWKKCVVEWLSIALLLAMIVVPLCMLGWFVFFTDTFIIQAVTVVDARDHTIEAVTSLVSPIQGKKILFIQTGIIERSLVSEIPQLHDAHVVRKLPGTIKVILQEKQPAILLLSNKKYYFVDREGIPYEEARLDTLPGIVLPVVKNNDQNTTVILGAPALDASFIELVVHADEEIPAIVDAHIAEMRIPTLAAREIHFLLDNNWVLKFDTTRPLQVQIQSLERLLEHTIPEEDRSNIEYIDLRIQNRVYYKLNAPSAKK